MATRGDPTIRIRARDETAAGFASANRRLQTLDSTAAAVGSRLTGISGGVAGIAAAAAGLVALQASSLVNTLDQIDGLVQRTGIAAQTLSELRVAADLNKTSLDSLARGVQFLGTRLTDAARGGRESSALFQALGIEIKNADGSLRAADQVLEDIADRFSGFEDGVEKSTLAAQLFGRAAGPELIPFLNQGKRGLQDARKEARELGVAYGEDFTKAAADFKDNLTRIRFAFEGLTARAITPSLRPLADFTGLLVDAAKQSDQLGAALQRLLRNNLGDGFIDTALAGLREVTQLTNQVIRFLPGLAPFRQDNIDAARGFLNLPRTGQNFAGQNLATSRGARPRVAAPVVDPNDGNATGNNNGRTGRTSAIAEADRYLESLRRQLQATQDLTVTEKLLDDIQAGRLGRVTNAQREALLGLAGEIDAAEQRRKAAEEEARALDELARVRSAAAAQQQRAEQALIADVQSLRDSNAALREQIEEIGLTAQELGRLEQARLDNIIATRQQELVTLQSAGASDVEIAALQENIRLLRERQGLLGDRATVQQAADDIARLRENSRELGLTFASAAEDAIVNFRSLGDVFRGLTEDIARLITRLLVTQPLAEALASTIGGLSQGGGLAAAFSGIFGFAQGGIMTSGGPLPLHTYSTGGIANRPQMAIFGEGDKAEAFVPLPDGRSIPVTMQGGGGDTYNINVTVTAQGGAAYGGPTAAQQGRQAGEAVERALRRYG